MRKALFSFALLTVSSAVAIRAQNWRPDAEIPACNTSDRKLLIRQAKLFLTIDQTSYTLKDEMIVDVGIRNEGRDDFYVYSKNGWEFSGFLFEFEDSAGNVVPRVFDHVPPPPDKNVDDATLFVKLRTNDFFGSRAHLLLKGFLKSPGQYTLRIAYRSPAMCGLYSPKIQALPALWHHDPDIFSNAVSFEFTP